jgi:hypothetical protein
MFTDIKKVIKGEMLRAQKDFERNPSATNWNKVTKSMLAYQQLDQLIEQCLIDDFVPMIEWPQSIVKLVSGMPIEEALA